MVFIEHLWYSSSSTTSTVRIQFLGSRWNLYCGHSKSILLSIVQYSLSQNQGQCPPFLWTTNMTLHGIWYSTAQKPGPVETVSPSKDRNLATSTSSNDLISSNKDIIKSHFLQIGQQLREIGSLQFIPVCMRAHIWSHNGHTLVNQNKLKEHVFRKL